MSERAGTAYQITVDCAEPDRMARFWALALGYELEGPPPSHRSWREYWISVGVPEDEVEEGYDSIVDPNGIRPRVWFSTCPSRKRSRTASTSICSWAEAERFPSTNGNDGSWMRQLVSPMPEP